MKAPKSRLIVVMSAVAMLVSVSSCATIRLDPSNRAKQVSVTFDKTIK